MVQSTKQKKAQQKNDSRKQKTFDKKLVIKAKRQKNPLAPFDEFQKYENHDGQFKISCRKSSDIDPEIWEWLFALEEKNMKRMYTESEWGWDFEKKKQEMTDISAYYLIASSLEGLPVAFSHFRFDMDYGQPVLYCYEIQLEASVRRLGLADLTSTSPVDELALCLETEELLILVNQLQSQIANEKAKVANLRTEILSYGGNPAYCDFLMEKCSKDSASICTDNPEAEDSALLKQVLAETQVLQLQKKNLTQTIIEEQANCINLKIQIKLLQMASS